MIKTFQNFKVELSGSLVTVKKDGELVKGSQIRKEKQDGELL